MLEHGLRELLETRRVELPLAREGQRQACASLVSHLLVVGTSRQGVAQATAGGLHVAALGGEVAANQIHQPRSIGSGRSSNGNHELLDCCVGFLRVGVGGLHLRQLAHHQKRQQLGLRIELEDRVRSGEPVELEPDHVPQQRLGLLVSRPLQRRLPIGVLLRLEVRRCAPTQHVGADIDAGQLEVSPRDVAGSLQGASQVVASAPGQVIRWSFQLRHRSDHLLHVGPAAFIEGDA